MNITTISTNRCTLGADFGRGSFGYQRTGVAPHPRRLDGRQVLRTG